MKTFYEYLVEQGVDPTTISDKAAGALIQQIASGLSPQTRQILDNKNLWYNFSDAITAAQRKGMLDGQIQQYGLEKVAEFYAKSIMGPTTTVNPNAQPQQVPQRQRPQIRPARIG